jgi:hypothetical protein
MNFEEKSGVNEKNLRNNVYPGRGIIIGRTPDGRNMVQVYWIMGRSENSRNRVFETEGGFVKIRPHDGSKVKDPSLIIYYPVRNLNEAHIVTNGDQTDTIYNAIRQGSGFEAALMNRSFEPDAPNYTPRISGIVNLKGGGSAYRLAVIRTEGGNPDYCVRAFYNFETAIQGFGHCIHTYKGDGDPLPSFEGDPYLVRLMDSIDAVRDYYWEALNRDNRISLLVKFMDVKSGRAELRIVNKHG